MPEIDLTAHLTFLCLSAIGCAFFAWLLQFRVAGSLKAIGLSVTEIVLGEALGMLFAKGLFYLAQIEYLNSQGAGAFFVFHNPTPRNMLKFFEQLSFFGGVFGVVLAVILSARIFGLSPRKVLNRFAPVGALLIALFRIAEYYLGDFGLQFPMKIGLAEDAVVSFPWGVAIDIRGNGKIIEYYLPIFMYEGLAALAAMLFALVRMKDRDCFIRTLFYICLAQVLLESIRNYSIVLLFVKVEQLMCFLYVEGVLVFYAVRRFRQRKWYGFVPPLLGMLAAGVVVLVEFALQNKIEFMKELGPMKMYMIMAAALATLGIADIAHHIIGKRLEKQAALR